MNRDLRSLFAQAGLAAAAGLLMGAAMQPDLRGELAAEGPQLQAGASGDRLAAYPPSGAGLIAYGAELPDYVIGTDWLRPPAPLPEPEWLTAEIPLEAEAFAFPPEPPPLRAAPRAWTEPPREPPLYPSLAGGTYYASDLPPPPPPPGGAGEPWSG